MESQDDNRNRTITSEEWNDWIVRIARNKRKKIGTMRRPRKRHCDNLNSDFEGKTDLYAKRKGGGIERKFQ